MLLPLILFIPYSLYTEKNEEPLALADGIENIYKLFVYYFSVKDPWAARMESKYEPDSFFFVDGEDIGV